MPHGRPSALLVVMFYSIFLTAMKAYVIMCCPSGQLKNTINYDLIWKHICCNGNSVRGSEKTLGKGN